MRPTTLSMYDTMSAKYAGSRANRSPSQPALSGVGTNGSWVRAIG